MSKRICELEVFTVPHLFRASPRGLAGCQHGPDPHTMGARSPYGVCAESELNARTPRTVPNRNSFARTGFQSARTPLIRIRLQKKFDTTESRTQTLMGTRAACTTTELIGHTWIG
jgi:hypothetical protein